MAAGPAQRDRGLAWRMVWGYLGAVAALALCCAVLVGLALLSVPLLLGYLGLTAAAIAWLWLAAGEGSRSEGRIDLD
ncbi:MAG: hypothetical protein AAGC46_21245 [Solirubrobacteraceae bacterium]